MTGRLVVKRQSKEMVVGGGLVRQEGSRGGVKKTERTRVWEKYQDEKGELGS